MLTLSGGKLDGKVAIVTGAARGRGAAEAEAFAAEGARVLLTDVLDTEGDAVAFTSHDVTSEEQWQTVTAGCMDRFGGLHVLVNNAGMIGTVAYVASKCSSR